MQIVQFLRFKHLPVWAALLLPGTSCSLKQDDIQVQQANGDWTGVDLAEYSQKVYFEAAGKTQKKHLKRAWLRITAGQTK